MASGYHSGLACGGTRRRSGTAACLAACVFLLLPATPAAQDCAAAEQLEFQEVALRGFTRLSGDAGSIEPLYSMVNQYLDAVQPNPFPTDIFQSLLRNQRVEPIKVVKYEAGYIVSLIIGALFFILMPLVGLFFCCCRCCGRCGGIVKERTRKTACQRNTLAVFLLMTTLIILAGVACAFTANQKLTESLETTVVEIKLTIAHVVSYIESLSKAAPAIAAQFAVPQKQVLAELDGLNRSLGFTVQGALEPVVLPVLEMLTARVRDFSETKSHLISINSTQHLVLDVQQQLLRELQIVRRDIRATLSIPSCQDCETSIPRLEDLRLNINYSEPSEFQAALQNIIKISQKDLNSSLDEGNRTFSDIPARVTSQTSRIIADIKVTVRDIEADVNSTAERLQLTDLFGNVMESLQDPQVTEITDSVKQYDRYRWIVAIVLCCIILLIIACNALGLGLGTAGIATRGDPYSANACSVSGANFLMAGVGISFIFSWLLILLVFVTFFVGGNVRTLVCKPWETGKIYQALDILATSNDFLNFSNIINRQLGISGIHSHCREGASIFDLLPQSQQMELKDSLNISAYTEVFKQSAERLNVDLGGLVLLDEAGRLSLLAFANTGINDLNYTELIQQISKPIVEGSLLDLASTLEDLESTQSDPEIKRNLSRHAMKLREIQNMTVITLQGHLAQLNASFQYLSSFAPAVQGTVQQTINNVEEAESSIQNTTRAVIRNVTQCFINKQMEYFRQYLNWVQDTIINDLLSCQPAIILLDNARILSCDYVTDPWNAFWFCLGWCTLFLIPSIIFAVKTAKHYRPVKNKAASPEFSEMTNFKFPRVQNVYAPTGTGLYESPASAP